jgi:hypothetical protein
MKQVKTMQFLMDVVGSAERIRESGTILPDSFFDHFQTLEQLISCNINLLNRANDFSVSQIIYIFLPKNENQLFS